MIAFVPASHRPRISPAALIRWVSAWIAAGAIGAAALGAQVAPAKPTTAEEFRQAGIAQAKSGHMDQAIARFKEGLVLRPGDPALLDAIGAAYSLKGDPATAKTYLAQSLQADPKSLTTRQNLAIVLFTLGQYDEATQQFATMQKEPGTPRATASLFLGLIAHRSADCRKAIPLLEGSGDLLYQYADALLAYSQCADRTGDRAGAGRGLEALKRLSGLTPAQAREAAELSARLGAGASEKPQVKDAAEVALQRAAQLEKQNQLEEAQSVLQRAASSAPSFELLLELAEVAKRRGDLAVAMKTLKQASETAPGREESYLEFSTICADHGNDQLALDTAETGLEHVPDSYRLMVQKGAVQEKLGHLKDAEETLRKALTMQKDNSIALTSMAVVQAHSGRPQEAEKTLAEAIAQFPDNFYMHYFRGKLLLQFAGAGAGTPDERETARRSLEKAIKLNPEYADSYYQLSELYRENSPQLAEPLLQKCLRIDPTHVPAQYALARLMVRTGRRAEGEKMLARLKAQQRTEEQQQQKQLRIELAQN